MTILQHQSLIAQLSQLDRHVDSLKFFSTPTPSFPSSSSTLLAVGSSRLTGQVWDGSLDIFDVSPVVRKREEKKERLEDCFASPLGSVQIPCGISSISWFPSSSSSSPPSLLTSGDDGVVRMWYLEKLETLEARAEGREGESEGDGDGRILIEVRHFNEHDDLVIGVEANPLEHSSPRFLTASWDST